MTIERHCPRFKVAKHNDKHATESITIMNGSNKLAQYGIQGAKSAPDSVRFTEVERFSLIAENGSDVNNLEEQQGVSAARSIVLQLVPWSTVKFARDLTENDKLYDGAWFNSLNNFIFRPCKLVPSAEEPEALLIYKKWFDSQSQDLQQNIKRLCKNHSLEISLFEGEEEEFFPVDKNANHSLLDQIYTLYHDQFAFSNFAQCASGPIKMVELSAWETRSLLEIGRRRCLTGSKLKDADLEEFHEKTLKAVEEYIQQHQETGVFVKTHDKSAKNDVIMKPLHSIREILAQLTFSRDLLGSLERMKSAGHLCTLVLAPWKTGITSYNEFRVFCQNHQVRAVAQQKWYLDLTKEEDGEDGKNLTPAKAVAVTRAAVKQYEQMGERFTVSLERSSFGCLGRI